MQNMDSLIKLSKGLITGIGIGGCLFSLLIISQGMYQQNQMNWAAFIAILASCFCIYIGLSSNGNEVEKI